MLRPLFTLLSAASLVLCVATCVLWVRSNERLDQFGRYNEIYPEGAESLRGQLRVRWRLDNASASPVRWRSWRAVDMEDLRSPEFLERAPADDEVLIRSDAEPAGTFGFGVYEIVPTKYGFLPGDVASAMPGSERWRAIVVPHWGLAVVSAVLPACWMAVTLQRHRGVRARRCVACGYDLRATPDRCPECGSAPAGRT